MSKDLIRQIQKLSRTPQVTFEKGLMRTEDDNQLGYVSDLENMIIEDGSVRRRQGSRLINDNTDLHYWVLLETIEISGTKMLIGIDTKRDCYCWLKDWPEYNFKLCKKGINPSFHIQSGADFHMSFNRGEKFWIINNDEFYWVINDYGDAYRINRNGFLQVNKVVTSIETHNTQNLFDAHYSSTNTDLGVFVEIKDATNHDAPQNFYLFDDYNDNVIPIDGLVRVAFKNECGVLSTFSEPQILPEYRKVAVSMIDGVHADSSNWNAKHLGIAWTSDSSSYYIAKSGTLSSPVYYLISAAATSGGSRRGSTVSETVFGNSNILYIASGAQTYINSAWTTWTAVSEDSYYLCPRSLPPLILTAYVTQIEFCASLTGFINFKSISGYVEAASSSSFTGFGERLVFIEEIVSTGGASDLYWPEYDLATGGASIVTTALTSMTTRVYSALTTGWNTQLFKLPDLDLDESLSKNHRIILQDSAGNNKASFYGAVFHAEADAYLDVSGNRLRYLNPVLRYDANSIHFGNKVGLNHNEFDTWGEITKYTSIGVGSLSSSVATVDPINQTVQFNTSNYTDQYYLVNEQGETTAYISYGSQFAVWNNGTIISESQVGFGTETEYYYRLTGKESPELYTASASSIWGAGPVWLVDEPDTTHTTFIKRYMPITSLEYSTVRAYPYAINDSRRVIKNPQHLAMNNGRLYVIQKGDLYIGGTDLLLYDRKDLSYTVRSMEAFWDGVLLFSSKGIYYLDSKGRERFVENKKAISTAKGDEGVFFIGDDSKVYITRMVVGESEVPFVRISEISQLQYDIEWGPNPQLIYVKDTLYIKTEKEIYGWKKGVWNLKYSIDDRELDMIADFDDELVVFFYNAIAWRARVLPKLNKTDFKIWELV